MGNTTIFDMMRTMEDAVASDERLLWNYAPLIEICRHLDGNLKVQTPRPTRAGVSPYNAGDVFEILLRVIMLKSPKSWHRTTGKNDLKGFDIKYITSRSKATEIDHKGCYIYLTYTRTREGMDVYQVIEYNSTATDIGLKYTANQINKMGQLRVDLMELLGL